MSYDCDTCEACREFDEDDYTICDVCRSWYCPDCDETTEFESECDGDCVAATGWVDPDKKNVEGECVCADTVKDFRKNRQHRGIYLVCNGCLYVVDPYLVKDTYVIAHLLKGGNKSKSEVIEDIKTEWKKQRVA